MRELLLNLWVYMFLSYVRCSDQEHLQEVFCNSQLLLVIDVIEEVRVVTPPPGSFDFPTRIVYDIKVKQILKNDVGFDGSAGNHELEYIVGGLTPCSPTVSIASGSTYIIKGNLGRNSNAVSLHPCSYRDLWSNLSKHWKKWFKKGRLSKDCHCKICMEDFVECPGSLKNKCVFKESASNGHCYKTGAICKKQKKKCKWSFTKDFKNCKQ